MIKTTQDMKEAVQLLKEGGVLAHPADTCYGLAADLMNEKALKKLQGIKGRDRNKPMSIMIPAFLKPKIEDYVVCDDFMTFVCEELLPGPVTIVLPKGPKIPDYFFPDEPNIGFRIPYDILTDTLLTKFQGPLITTSANLSDQPVCCSYEDVVKAFEENPVKPDLIFQGVIKNHCLPSTVILPKDKKVIILREGPIDKKKLEALLGVEVE